jgi:hypothetical protein
MCPGVRGVRRSGLKYSPEAFRDAPVSLQLVGKNFCDKELVAVGKIVEKAVRA